MLVLKSLAGYAEFGAAGSAGFGTAESARVRAAGSGGFGTAGSAGFGAASSVALFLFATPNCVVGLHGGVTPLAGDPISITKLSKGCL